MKILLTASIFRWLRPALLGCAAMLSAQASATPTVERVLNGDIAATTRSVRIDHRSGPVTIVGVDSGFGWKWTLSCSADREADAQAYVKESEIDVKETAGTLQVELLLPKWEREESFSHLLGRLFSSHHNFGVRSELELRLPRAAAVELSNRFGSSKLTALTGAVTINCQNGRVELGDLSGAVNAATSFGTLHAERLGHAQLHNQNGAVEIADVTGDLRASTSFGRMQVRHVKGRVDLKNQNGGIEAEDIDGALLAATSFSHLRVTGVKGNADLRNQNSGIEARNITGNVIAATSFAELVVADVGGGAALTCQNGRIDATRVGDDLMASNTFGSLHAQDIHGRADLDAQNGAIVANNIAGDLRAKTSFAKMELDTASKHIDARNQNGSVQITARSRAVERIAASASFAAIDIRLPSDVQPLIRASTSFGKVRSDYPVLLADSIGDAKFYADSNQPKVDLRGQNGDIRIQALAGR